MTKFIFVTGGVLSSLGKGILASSIARLLKNAGVNASAMKIDPYLNCDAGTLNPYEHGETFVTRDGFECDLDVGNYERFLDVFANKEQNLMMGSVYRSVTDKERKGEFLGSTVQLIPHATNEIKERIRGTAKVTGADVLLVEIGGTVGDMESDVVLEAARQMRFENGEGPSVLFVHLALVPTIITGEQKTKPLQHSVKALLSRGITPDIVVARSEKMFTEDAARKIALYCNVRPSEVYCSPNQKNIYRVPSVLKEQGILKSISERLDLQLKDKKDAWDAMLDQMEGAKKTRKIAVVGKYSGVMKDTYMSIFEALVHAAAQEEVKPEIELISSEAIEKGKEELSRFDGFLIPGGFGARGVEGKIECIRYAREHKKPLLGICYGFQLSIVETARNLLGLKDANTTEVNPQTRHPVIDILPEQRGVTEKGGTMRLGAYPVQIKPGTKAAELYSEEIQGGKILKRFRHRFEVNPKYVDKLEGAGWVFSGRDPHREIMKAGEFKGHPFLFGVQYHPEFDSRLERPEPSYRGFVEAMK